MKANNYLEYMSKDLNVNLKYILYCIISRRRDVWCLKSSSLNSGCGFIDTFWPRAKWHCCNIVDGVTLRTRYFRIYTPFRVDFPLYIYYIDANDKYFRGLTNRTLYRLYSPRLINMLLSAGWSIVSLYLYIYIYI